MTEQLNKVAFQSAVINGLTDSINRYGARHDLPRLAWTPDAIGGCDEMPRARVDGHASLADLPDDEHVAAAQGWAEHLGLTEVTDVVPHTREWHGRIGWLPVRVWAVTDWEAWENGAGR